MVEIRLEGSKELQAALDDISDDVRAEVSKAVIGTAVELRGDVMKSIKKPGTGTMYYRIFDPDTGFTNIFAGDSEGYVTSVKGRLNLSATHRASADGEPPASDTGRLLSSIYFDEEGPLSAVVGSDVDYAVYLEYGTLTMAARPFFRPAVDDIRAKYNKRLEAAIRRATQ